MLCDVLELFLLLDSLAAMNDMVSGRSVRNLDNESC